MTRPARVSISLKLGDAKPHPIWWSPGDVAIVDGPDCRLSVHLDCAGTDVAIAFDNPFDLFDLVWDLHELAQQYNVRRHMDPPGVEPIEPEYGTCSDCGGTGERWEGVRCAVCRGNGEVLESGEAA